MSEINDTTTLPEAFARAVRGFPDAPFLAVPRNPERAYLPGGYEITYARAGEAIAELAGAYRAAGYGVGHRVATLLENRPDYVLHKLALNSLGVCCVPINPDYRAGEIAYLLDHCKPHLLLGLESRVNQLEEGLAQSTHRPHTVVVGSGEPIPTVLGRAAGGFAPEPSTPASILYTSGTTGRPKGCVLSHGYEVASGAWYASLGGLVTLRPGKERIYNPLPLYHVNAAVVSLIGAILTGNCQIQPDRFSPQRWWREVVETRASIVHYLGIVAPLLIAQAPCAEERQHEVRLGIGAGIEPQLHAAFEQRFGFPMVEVWGMTEMVRVLADNIAPREIGTRAFGRARPGIEVRVVDESDRDVPDGQPGEMLIRHSADTPRRDFFSGYLDDEAATEAAWRGGWFHTGDTVVRAPDGMLHFMDRKKHIIRRSGENIAAAEVEALLQSHSKVAQVAVLAVPDEVREEEVLACVVPAEGLAGDAALARELFAWCHERLAYYKAPGWVRFMDTLPTTGTQKIQKHQIYPGGMDPRQHPDVQDFRNRKRRA